MHTRFLANVDRHSRAFVGDVKRGFASCFRWTHSGDGVGGIWGISLSPVGGEKCLKSCSSAGVPVKLEDNGTWTYLKSQGGAVERLNKATQSPEFVKLIDGLFSQIGLEVLDTREKLTCRHQGDRVEVQEGVDADQVDFHLKLYSYQIDRLIENARTGYQDPLARFRLTREFLDALPHYVSRLLNNSLVTNSAFRNLIRAKDLIHVHLVSPDSSQEPDVTYTLFFVNGAWHVTRGLVGKAERVFKLSADDGLDLMRHGHQSTKSGLADIPKFAQWYVDWPNKVEVKNA